MFYPQENNNPAGGPAPGYLLWFRALPQTDDQIAAEREILTCYRELKSRERRLLRLLLKLIAEDRGRKNDTGEK